MEKKPLLARATGRGRRDGASVDAPGGLRQLATLAKSCPPTQALRAHQTRANGSPVVQRVKTELNDANVFRGNMRAAIQKEFPGQGAATPQAIFDASRAYYEGNVVRGRRLIAELSAQKEDPDAVAANTEKAADNDAKHSALYDTVTPESTNRAGLYLAGTSARDHPKKAYTNNIVVPDRSIQTNENYAKHDPNRGAGNYLSNSEVFWQQWKAGVAKDTQKGIFKNARRKSKQKDLKDIIRVSISNSETLMTAHYALPNGTYFQAGTTFEYGPDQEEFAALLGTPNGRGVGYLLKDHYHELKRNSFGSVQGTGDTTNLKFNLA